MVGISDKMAKEFMCFASPFLHPTSLPVVSAHAYVTVITSLFLSFMLDSLHTCGLTCQIGLGGNEDSTTTFFMFVSGHNIHFHCPVVSQLRSFLYHFPSGNFSSLKAANSGVSAWLDSTVINGGLLAKICPQAK